MRRGIVWLVLALTGCDKVLGLKENSPVFDAAICPSPNGPDVDDDGDGALNGIDPCPLFPNEDTGNEDGDPTLDSCDLCPQLEGDLAGADLDCDGLGAACDPNPDAPNTRRFLGFGTQNGVTLYMATVANGAVQMAVTNAVLVNELTVRDPGALPARFEVETTIENALVAQYWSFIVFVKDGAKRYEIQLEKLLTTHTMNLVIDLDGTGHLAQKSIGQLATPSVSFKLQATITADRIAGKVDISGVGATTAEAAVAITGPVTYGFTTYRDPNAVATTTTSTTPYLIYTTLAP